MKASMNPPKLIATQSDFGRFIEQISQAKHLAVDSESNSYFAYRPRICLIQISANNKDFILDPLTLKDLTDLGRILLDSSVEKIIHAAEKQIATAHVYGDTKTDRGQASLRVHSKLCTYESIGKRWIRGFVPRGHHETGGRQSGRYFVLCCQLIGACTGVM